MRTRSASDTVRREERHSVSAPLVVPRRNLDSTADEGKHRIRVLAGRKLFLRAGEGDEEAQRVRHNGHFCKASSHYFCYNDISNVHHAPLADVLTQGWMQRY